MYVNGGCNKCDFSEPDRGYGPPKCSLQYCGGYTPTPIKCAVVFEEVYKLLEQKSGKKILFDTVEEFNIFYG